MAKDKHPDVGYLTGLITENGVIVIVAASEKLEDEDVPHAFLAILKDNSWKVFEEGIDIVSVAAGKGKYSRHLASLGMQGEVIINDPNAVHHEHVHKGKNGPSNLRTMHAIRAVDEFFVAVGMRRQVYRRKTTGGNWQRYDADVLLAEQDVQVAGFLSVDGFSDSELYAVGYRGEIWLQDGRKWQRIDSPTSARLECVRCGADGSAVICGENGLVLEGRGSTWTVIDPGGVDVTLKSVTQFKERWYLADEEGSMYSIVDGDLKEEANFSRLNATCGVVDSNATALLSIGEEDIVLFDGNRWQRLSHPPVDPG